MALEIHGGQAQNAEKREERGEKNLLSFGPS
jgi:hypothetical protein